MASAVSYWIQEAFGRSHADVRVIVPDRRGALRAIPPGPRGQGYEHIRARRRTAFSACRPVRAELAGPADALAIFPVKGGRAAIGLLEVRGDAAAIESRWGLLDTVAAILAPVLTGLERTNGSVGSSPSDWKRSSARDEMLRRVNLAAVWTAHEFKGPLAAARTSLEYLLGDEREVGKQERQLIDRSRRGLERLSQSVDGLLAWSVGVDPLSFEPVDLSAIVGDAANDAFSGSARLLEIDAPRPVWVNGVPVLLQGAVANLVRNAAAYSPAGGTVTVSVRRADRKAVVRVDDEGPGVPEREREAIFAPMVRGSAGRGKGIGSGLGLFIAHQAISSHGGRIWMQPAGAGSSFRFEIPTGEVRPPSAS